MKDACKKRLKEVVLILKETGKTACTKQEIASFAKELEAHGAALSLLSPSAIKAGRKEAGDVCGRLYLSDAAAPLLCLKEEGAYAMPFLHAHNREEDFAGFSYAIESLADVEYGYLQRVYLRLAGEPWTILETSRCRLREMTLEDVPALYEIYADAEVTRYIENLYADREEELCYTKAYIEHVYGFYGYGIWIIEEKESGRVIGRAGIECKEGQEGVELGFVVARDKWRQGIAAEVVGAILLYAKEEAGISRVYARVEEGNAGSAGFCRSMGFVQAGVQAEGGKRYWVLEREL